MEDFKNLKTTYTFIADTVGYPSSGDDYPTDSTITMSFDATDANIHLVIRQFETFLRAAGYIFKDIEVI